MAYRKGILHGTMVTLSYLETQGYEFDYTIEEDKNDTGAES